MSDKPVLCETDYISSYPEELCKKGILENVAKLTGKHLCWSPFLKKVAGVRFVEYEA